MVRTCRNCFGSLCSRDANGNDDGYSRLEFTETASSFMTVTTISEILDSNDYFQPINSYQLQQRSESQPVELTPRHVDVEINGKQVQKKLLFTEICKRIGQILHSTWKWMKRGAVAITPASVTFLYFAPFPIHALVIANQHGQVDRDFRTVIHV